MVDTNKAASPNAAADVDTEQVLDGIRTTAYRWDFATDRMDWAKNAGSVLGGIDMAMLKSGRSFGLHIDSKHAAARYDGVAGGAVTETNTKRPYVLQYRFLPEGRRRDAALWIEERGVCETDALGQAIRAQGTLSVIGDRRRRSRFQDDWTNDSHMQLPGRVELTAALAGQLRGQPGREANNAFLLVGVNDLTRINETFGYGVGDEVLSILGQRITTAIRGKDFLGSFSSTKFGVILRNCDIKEVAAVARPKISAAEPDVVGTSGGSVAASVFVGAVLLPDHGLSANDAIALALQSADVARSNRHERFYCYDPDAPHEAERKKNAAIADEVIRALNDRRIMLALQPVVSADSHTPEFHESLLRLRMPDGSVLNASEFVP
ncbi:MAG: diguanylate cyclase, partial [Pseudomonadota bacterium]